jgi:HD-like signal output (HDOD) protein
MLVADGAAMLASGTGKMDLDDEMQKTAQTAGIIHNLGLLWMAENMPNETGQALNLVSNDTSFTVSQALNQFADFDYCEVGYWLGHEWGLPEILLIPMRYHINNHYQGQFWEISHLVGAAAIMAGTLYKGGDNLPENDFLEQLEISRSFQQETFYKLAKKLEKTRELVKILFN